MRLAAPLPRGSAARGEQEKHILGSIAAGERRAMSRLSESRPLCERCVRPPSVCVCDVLPASPIATRTSVLVLQHPNEFRRKHFSTTPLLPLSLSNVRVKVGSVSYTHLTLPTIYSV